MPGESVTIFGRNGAGKSTLLKIVSTLIRSYRGDVELFGTNLRRADARIRARVGFVSHEALVYGDLTVHDNLMFFARLYGLDRPQQRVEAMIREMDLEDKTNTSARALSRGMKQRLSLGRAFLHEPELLLLDEPFTGLDERAAELLDARLSARRETRGATLMATHDAERGWRHAGRIAVLDRGRVAYETTPAETPFDAFRQRYREILAGS